MNSSCTCPEDVLICTAACHAFLRSSSCSFLPRYSDGRLAEEFVFSHCRRPTILLPCRLPEQAGRADWSMPERSLRSFAIHMESIRLVFVLQCLKWHRCRPGSPETHQQERKCSRASFLWSAHALLWALGGVRCRNSSKTIQESPIPLS